MRYLILILCLIANPGFGSERPPGNAGVSGSDIDRVHRAAGQLVRSQLPSGFFPYDFDFSSGHAADMQQIKGFNLVRQTGAAFALGEYLEALDRQPVRVTLETFLHQTARQSLPIGKGTIQQGLESLGVYNRWRFWKSWREPLYRMGLLFAGNGEGRLVTVHDDYELAWPGATALSLIAALKYREATGDSQFDTTIVQWKDGLLALKVPGRGFREAPHYLTESPYVNGEAWLAFAEYHKVFPEDQATRKVLLQLDSYMIQKYTDRPSTRFYHWGTMAAAVRASSSADARFDEFLYELAEQFLAEKEQQAFPKANSCGSVEGLATFAGFMRGQDRDNDPLAARAREFITRAMRVNRTLQVDSGMIGKLPYGSQYIGKLNDYRGAFIKSLEEPVMRVDFTQHCLNAMLRMERAGLAQ